MPDEHVLHWAIIEESSTGPILRGHGTAESSATAFDQLKGIPADALYISSVFPGLPTLCRQVCLPVLPLHEIKSALYDTLEQTVAVGVTNSEIAFACYKNADNMLAVMAYLAQREPIQKHIDALQAYGVNPEWIIPKAACLAAFIDHFKVSDWNYIVDVSANETVIVLTYQKKVIESRALVGGTDTFQTLPQPHTETAEWSPSEQLKRLLQHIAETLASYKEHYTADKTIPLTVTGEILHIPLAATIISEYVSCPLSSLQSIEESSPLVSASTIGAALLTQAKAAHTLPPTFRTGTLAFPHPLLHWKKPLLCLVSACLVMISIILSYAHFRQQKIAAAMHSEWEQIVSAAHLTPEEVSTQSGMTGTDPEDLLNQEEWLLGQIEKKSLFPLQPNIPAVSDVISWLTNEIIAVTASHQDPENLKIDNLVYSLVKRPSKLHPKEHYQVRIDLDISSPSIVLARALHDKLLAKNGFIDGTSELRWSGSNGKYHASFFLKDKTRYPQQNV